MTTMLYKYIYEGPETKDGSDYHCYTEEHMLYPIEIARAYGVSNDSGSPDGKLVKKAILDYLEKTNNEEKYYYNGRWGKIRCFPVRQYHPAVMELIQGGKRMAEQLTNKVCPNCGATMFLGTYVIPVVVEVNDTENEDEKYNILRKNEKGASINVMKCARCKKDITEEELVSSVVCKECGRSVSPSDVDENGICDVCRAKKERADLANATHEELIHRLLQLEAMNSKTVKDVVASQKAAEQAVTEEQQVTDAVSDAMNPPEQAAATDEQAKEGEKKTRKRKVNKAKGSGDANAGDAKAEETEAPTEEVNEEPKEAEPEQAAEPVTEEEAKEAVDDIANAQDAPFPVVQNLPGFEEQSPLPVQMPVQEEPAIGTGFQMFDNQDSPAF